MTSKASIRNSSHLIIYHVLQVSSISLSVLALQSKMFFLKEEKLQGKEVKIQNCRTVLINTKKTTTHPKIHSALGSVLTGYNLDSFLQSNGWWKKDEDQSGSPVPAVFPLSISCLPPSLLCTPQVHLLAGQYKKQNRSQCCPIIRKFPELSTRFSAQIPNVTPYQLLQRKLVPPQPNCPLYEMRFKII